MQGDKEKLEISVLGRLASLEALVFLMGVASLVFGLVTGSLINILIGVIIVTAGVMLAWKWKRVHSK
ncbi:hypothetical protein [Geomonas sp.]|uniref:hypothetical protein n=1 Tax=Geomonas sp. TaxID=2651584 RepID=UPI002B48FA18|nr:hypothetical protein [Geomonas sp.]HJV36819.1 hypothetical protein [Geomonas sp.]